MLRSTILICSALACAACNVTEPDRPEFAFSVTRISTMDYNNPRLSVTGHEDSVVVEGQTWTACANGALAGSLLRPNERGLTLVITDVQDSDGCPGAVSPFDYRAVIGELPAGRFHLQILLRHSRGLTPPRTIFHDFVDVR